MAKTPLTVPCLALALLAAPALAQEKTRVETAVERVESKLAQIENVLQALERGTLPAETRPAPRVPGPQGAAATQQLEARTAALQDELRSAQQESEAARATAKDLAQRIAELEAALQRAQGQASESAAARARLEQEHDAAMRSRDALVETRLAELAAARAESRRLQSVCTQLRAELETKPSDGAEQRAEIEAVHQAQAGLERRCLELDARLAGMSQRIDQATRQEGDAPQEPAAAAPGNGICRDIDIANHGGTLILQINGGRVEIGALPPHPSATHEAPAPPTAPPGDERDPTRAPSTPLSLNRRDAPRPPRPQESPGPAKRPPGTIHL